MALEGAVARGNRDLPIAARTTRHSGRDLRLLPARRVLGRVGRGLVLHPAELDAMFPAAEPASSPLAELIEPLTPRESEVLQMLASGLANKEIATRLAISEHTVKFHVASILGKLGAASRTEAVTLGIRRGLVLL